MPSSSCIIHLASRHGAGVEVFVLSLKSYLISAGDSPCGRDVLLVGVEVSPSLVIIARGDSAKFTLHLARARGSNAGADYLRVCNGKYGADTNSEKSNAN